MRSRLPSTFVELVKIWGSLALIVVLGFAFTYRYVGAPPPKAIRIATGPVDGAYYTFAHRYARLLADDGIVLDVVSTAGSIENFELLKSGAVDLALVQGGSASDEERGDFQTLGSLFLEPMWVFTPADKPLPRLGALKGARVAVGETGSGTYRLATQILAANGVTDANADWIRGGAASAREGIVEGDVAAAFLVASPAAPVVQDLVSRPPIAVFAFERAAAYSHVFPFLTPVVVSEGALDLSRNVPPRDITLVAVAASLAARRDLNTSLVPSLMAAVTRVHQRGGLLERPRQFPSIDFVDLPMNRDAARYITQGPSFLYRWLPYGTAVRIDRLKVMLLPLLALLLPLLRLAPPLYQWRMRSKIYRWYAAVRELDAMVLEEPAGDSGASVMDRLRALEQEVASVTVPLAYAGELYHLRLHINLLGRELESRSRREDASGRREPSLTGIRSRTRGS